MTGNRIVACIGAANMDINGFSKEKMNMRDSNPGRIELCPGGVCRNIAENLARMGVTVRLVSAVGDDDFSDLIRLSCRRAGIDDTEVETVPGTRSSAYLALLDSDGDMFAAISDMHIIKNMSADFIRRHSAAPDSADVIVIDPGLSPECLAYITETWKEKKIVADPVSITYAGVLKPFLSRLFAVKCNTYEAEVLSGLPVRSEADLIPAADRILEAGTECVVITRGTEGCFYRDRSGLTILKPCDPVKMVNASGAGDAFTAGFVYGLIHGYDADTTLTYSMAAAKIALLHHMTVNPEMSSELVKKTAGLI